MATLLPMELAKKEFNTTTEFINMCPIICIIDPKANFIIYYDVVGQAEGDELQKILNYLKDYE